MKTKAWMRSHFCREENTNIAEKRSVGGKKGRNAGSSIFFSLVFVFLQTVAKPPTWASMASLHRPTSGLHCRSKRKKEDTYFSSDSFLAAFYAYRQNHKATSDGAAVRKTKTKTKKTQTNKQITQLKRGKVQALSTTRVDACQRKNERKKIHIHLSLAIVGGIWFSFFFD